MWYELHPVLTNCLLWDELHIGQMNTSLHLVNMLGPTSWPIVWLFLFKIMLVVVRVFSRLLASALLQLPVFYLVT
jgi:hypothetical protein